MTLAVSCALAAERYTGPIIDAHGHLGASFDWNVIIEAMDKNNVSKLTVMARYYPGPEGPRDLPSSDGDALRLADRHPGRFFPLIEMQRPMLTGAHKWHTPDAEVERLFEETERKLATGRFYGIGEFIVRHWAYSRGPHAEIDHPIYSLLMQRFSKLAAKHDVPIVVHMEGEPQLVRDFQRLLSENRGTRYVWAHNCGRSHANASREMLFRHSNLWCDLGGMTNVGQINYGTGRPRMAEFTSLMEQDGVLLPEMKALYEEFPDRFMLGMDVAHAPGMNMRNYSRRAERFRELLGQLKPETARKFAELNAVTVFKLTTGRLP